MAVPLEKGEANRTAIVRREARMDFFMADYQTGNY